MPTSFELDGYILCVKGIEQKGKFSFILDGVPAEKQDFRYRWDESVLKVSLPYRVFDARPHRIDILCRRADEKKSLTFRHQSVYEGQLNGADQHAFGWIHDTTRPGFVVELEFEINGQLLTSVLAEHENVYAPEKYQNTGFGTPLSFGANDSELRKLEIRVLGTDFLPFGDYLVNIKARTLQQAYAGTIDDRRVDAAIDDMGRDFLLTAAREAQLGVAARPLPGSWKMSGPRHKVNSAGGIDVIIPVYRGIKETMACINSVIGSHVETAYRLIVINDASPQLALTKILRKHAAKHGYMLLENPENLGFVQTVNRGMALSLTNDVVLLNADTIVSDGWLDRMFHAAYREEKIGSVSALSNNATICSLPFIGGKDELPYGLSLAEINDLCLRENRNVSVDLPTAHGFCMYIRRKCLSEVGLFDAARFGKGYGEENEFSLRSARRGWRHIAACDVFVYHKGSVSFRENADIFIQKNLGVIASEYPDYEAIVFDFLHNDPMAPVRNRVQLALWQDKPNVVLASLDVGGGVETNVAFLAAKLKKEGYRVLIAKRTKRENYTYSLGEWEGEDCLLYTRRAGLAAMCADLLALNPAFIHLHHVIDMDDGLDKFLQSAKIPYFVTLHDYFYICPRVTLLDDSQQYCQLPDTRSCNMCLKRGGAHPFLDKTYKAPASDIDTWREKWLPLLEKAAGVFAPSEATTILYRKIFLDLAISTQPHLGPQPATVQMSVVAAPARIRVAILGAIGEHKGSGKLIAILKWAERHSEDIEFVLIGYSDKHDQLNSFDNFEDLGPYKPDTLAEKVAEAQCQVALFLSMWPETYIYTLSEALQHGLTPVALDLGAAGTRLRPLGCGVLVPADASPAAVVDAIRVAATQKIQPGSYSEGDYTSLTETYYRFHAEDFGSPADCVMLPFSQGVYNDGWAGQEIRLYFAARRPVNHLQIELLTPPIFGPQFVRASVNGHLYDTLEIPRSHDPRRLDIITKPTQGLIYVDLSFSLINKLPDPDLRMASAKLLASQFIADHGMVKVNESPNPMSARLVSARNASLESLTEIDPSGALEGLYRDVANYSLFRETESAAGGAKGLINDLLWSARLLRRDGVKSAVKSLVAMRTLRKAPFDKTFYRMQLERTPHKRMDPINHYVVFGAKEGFDPAPGFSSEYYINANPDVSESRANPFVHYLRHGRAEDRRIEPSGKIGQFFQGLTKRRPRLREAARTSVLATPETLVKLTYEGPALAREISARHPQLGATGFVPDATIVACASEGEHFFDTFGLLGDAPQAAAAVEALNAGACLTASAGVPDVTIIIPVHGNLGYTLNCLRSLLAHRARKTFEIIVADDASQDATPDCLPGISGIRYIRFDENGGFIETCNKAAREARGAYLVFLNNDTMVCPSWLDGLTGTYTDFPKCGIVGSKLYYPDGHLQEAGGIVWRDGSAWNYGRNDDPQRPEYGYARAVDYVSGAALCIHRSIWEQLNGFDTRYRPAYYEDTDLAFRVRRLGYQVIMQPVSKVVHYEGKTSGTDTSSGAKAYQTENKVKFFERWRDALLAHRENGQLAVLERDRDVNRRVLIVDACNPTPERDAGSQATVELIRLYRDLGYQVSFVPEDNFLYQPEHIAPLQAMGVQCFYAPYFSSLAQILREFGDLYDVVNLIRPAIAFRCVDLVRQYCPRAKLVYLNADLHYLRMERQARVENKPDLLDQAAAFKARELAAIKASDTTLVHSYFERDVLLSELPDARVEVLPLVEQAVDTQAPYFDRDDIIFLGGYNHPPNLDAALWIIDAIWPELHSRVPNARLLMVGANPPQALKDRATDRVIITGQVDDLLPWFDRSRLFLAALRYGAGAKGKVLKAMAHGVPVIATDIAAEGLQLENGKTVFIGNSKAELIEETVKLYEANARHWNRISLDAQDYIAEFHSRQAGLNVLKRVLA